MSSLGLNSFINAQGFARTGMLTVSIGAACNLILDPVFIFILGMGVKGAALATIISQFIAALWTFTFLTGKKTIIKIEKDCLIPNFKRTMKILDSDFQALQCQLQTVPYRWSTTLFFLYGAATYT